jgi:DNA-binding LytR/AlgR family response regulator
VDSQIDAINNLKQQLSNYPNYICVGIAKTKEDAINIILDELPHLVFIEAELGEGVNKSLSFSIIPETYRFLNSLPEFIVMNATKGYSYESIKNGVFDYILKPLNYYEVKKTLLRFENKQPENSSICLKSYTEYRFLLVNDIVYLKADNNTTDFFLTDGSIITSYKTLKTFEKELPNIFVRVHRSYIINIGYLTKIHFSRFQCSLKFTKTLIPFSKSLKTKMLEIKEFWMSNFSNGIQQQINMI